MKPTKSQTIKKVLSIYFAAFSFAAILMSSIAWFSNGSSIIDFGSSGTPNLVGGMEVAYFGGGSGTENDPYIISNRNHLYNLAWLQYLGKFNTVDYTLTTPEKSIQEKFFKITNDIDMKGMVLPPIGTETYPFFGHLYSDKLDDNGNFTGEPCSIINLVVSNDDPRQSDSDFGVNKPKKINDFGHAFKLNNADNVTRVIGFMGAVGKIPTNSSVTASEVSSITPSLENITLENIRIQNKTQQMLIGLAAGYVDGTMKGVKVSGSSYLKIEKINGQSDAIDTTRISKNLSDYGLVGYSKYTGSSGGFSQTLSKFYDSEDPAHGGNSWGGSFDARSYNRWIYDLYKSSVTDNLGNTYEYSTMKSGVQTSPYTHNKKVFTDFTLRFGTAVKTEPYGTQAKGYTKYTYYADPDSFNEPPDNHSVDTPSSGKPKSIVYQLKDDCYLPLKFEDGTKTSTHIKNTGYIVGATYDEEKRVNGSPKIASYYYAGIGNSLQNTQWAVGSALAQTGLEYDNSKLEVLTYSQSDSAWRRISDEYNANNECTNGLIKNYTKVGYADLGLTKYKDSRKSVKETFEAGSRIHGIHFEQVELSKDSVLSVSSGIKINGETPSGTYQLPKGSVDFNLKKTGIINFFAGTYYTATRTFNFFSIYKVNRSGGTISSLQRISKIYTNTNFNSNVEANSATNPQYVYQFNGESKPSNAGSLVFDVATVLEGNCSINNTLFYFEVPVNDGEYAFGMVPGKSASTYTGAYLIYLDIAVNGEDGVANSVSAYSVTTSAKSNKYPMGVDFAISGIGDNGGETFCVVISASASGHTKYDIVANKVTISSGGGTTAIAANYSYRSTKYVATDPPPDGKFTVAGADGYDYVFNNPTKRVSHISVRGEDGLRHLVIITDIIDDGEIVSTTCSYDYVEMSLSTIQNISHAPLLTNDIVNAIRGQGAAIILTRTDDSNDAIFDCELPNNPLDWPDKDIYNVTIRPYPTGLKLSISNENASRYTLTINGATISFAESNPVIYTGS